MTDTWTLKGGKLNIDGIVYSSSFVYETFLIVQEIGGHQTLLSKGILKETQKFRRQTKWQKLLQPQRTLVKDTFGEKSTEIALVERNNGNMYLGILEDKMLTFTKIIVRKVKKSLKMKNSNYRSVFH
ncbi:uncharacterized protein LOC143049205 [Mytilus galloprovincialis]|uniref:uncharacterized protein LOC143049205 n=1 Tax=Mytilus galloprovincialis TaxID=29158 RepID=UPI003F7C4631